MSDQDYKKAIEAMEALTLDLPKSPEKARAFLVKVGIVTTSGELTEPYKQGA